MDACMLFLRGAQAAGRPSTWSRRNTSMSSSGQAQELGNIHSLSILTKDTTRDTREVFASNASHQSYRQEDASVGDEGGDSIGNDIFNVMQNSGGDLPSSAVDV
jgi:hypothetical protein